MWGDTWFKMLANEECILSYMRLIVILILNSEVFWENGGIY